MKPSRVHDISEPGLQETINKFVVLFVLLSCMFTNSVKSELHKWTDENGTIHYTNVVPPSGARNITSSKEIVESPLSRSIRLEQEQHDKELRSIEKKYEESLRKQEREAKKRMQEQIRKIKKNAERKNKVIKLSGQGIYLHPGDIVCRTSSDVYSYYYHTYHNNPLNLSDLFADGLCWKLKGSKDVIWVSSKIEKHPYGKSVEIQYWHEGRKVIAYTHPKNVNY